jgi:hypothetical protein
MCVVCCMRRESICASVSANRRKSAIRNVTRRAKPSWAFSVPEKGGDGEVKVKVKV